MVKWLMRRGIAAFERQWNYDASYLHEIIEVSPRAAWMFSRAAAIGKYREDVPVAAWAAAAITAVRHEDCGPCTQLGVAMAERAGVDAKTLRAVLTEDEASMPDDVALAWRFARATIDHDPSADRYRDEIIKRWGPRAVISLAFAMVASRIYPTVKYAMGHGQACTRIVVGGAQDAVQEAYMRWHEADRERVADPRAFLMTTTTRICLDVLKSARVRREEYVGPWLPDPVTDTSALAPVTQTELAEDLSVALLLALDRLSPLERAAFLLHDVFDYSFTHIADALGRNEAACRQLASRARARVRDARPTSAHPLRRGEAADATPTPRASTTVDAKHAELLSAFITAARSGDLATLTRLLARDARIVTDGGGKVPAALNVIQGADRAAAFLTGAIRKGWTDDLTVRFGTINGLPGLIVTGRSGLVQTNAFEIEGDVIKAIYVVRNPNKLKHISA